MFKFLPLLLLPLSTTINAGALPRQEHIQWTSCPDINVTTTFSYNCSTLSVPLDYSARSNGSINLELVRVLAPQQPSRGSILLNFGGPGAESRNAAVALAPQLLESSGGIYDLITFDPRGTANTVPFNCSANDLDLYALSAGFRFGNSSDVAVAQDWVRAHVLASQCQTAHRATGDYIGTGAGARDLMSVVDALGEDGLLRYWGFSYGTTLGATVAAMFPDRMDKVILDGVQNVHEYYNAIGISQQWTDSDKVFSGMWSTCIDAGPELCHLAASYNDSHELENVVWNLLWSLKSSPVLIGSNASVVVDYDVLKGILVNNMYSTTTWPTTAEIINLLLKGQTGDDLLELVSLVAPLTAEGFLDTARLIAANFGIQCSDRFLDARVDSLDQIMPTLEKIGKLSRLVGDVTLPTIMSCNIWKFNAKERYTGDWQNIRTRTPILVIGNTFDGLTPLVSARNTSASFVDSVVLEVNGYGHASLNLKSNCTTAATAAYFMDGVLPREGTVCPVDVLPYHPLV